VALLLLAAILATLLGAPARVGAAPSVDTWVAPSPPRLDPETPFFYDVKRHALTMVELEVDPARIYRLSDKEPRVWIATDVPGQTPEGWPRFGNWAYDPIGDRLLLVSHRSEPPPCCDDTARTRYFLDVYQLELSGTHYWQRIAVVDPPLERYDFSTVFDPTRNRLLIGFGYEANDGTVSTTVAALDLNGAPHWTTLVPSGAPLLRLDSALFVDTENDRLLAFGGYDPSRDWSQGVWTLPLDGNGSWQRFTEVDTLPPLPGGAPPVVFDPLGNRLLAYSRYYRDGAPDTVGYWQFRLQAGTGWTALPITGGPRAHSNASLTFDAEHNRLFLFGGAGPYPGGYDYQRFDIREMDDVDAGAFHPVQLCGDAQEIGAGGSIVLDTRRHRVVTFSAREAPSDLELNTISQTDHQDWERLPRTIGETTPPGRSFASVVYDSLADRTILFGGKVGQAELGDLWQLTWTDDTHPQWQRLFLTGDVPGPRWGVSTVYDPVRRRIVFFGGFAGRPLAETWALELDALRWRQIELRGFPPSARFGASAVYDSRRDGMILYGGNAGTTNNPIPLGDTWFLSFRDGDVWIPVTIADRPPLPRWMHAAIYDPVRDRMLVFWGRDQNGSRYDCAAVEWAGRPTWTTYKPAGPAADIRSGHAVVYDAAADRAIIVGGNRGGANFSNRRMFDWYLDFAPGSVTGPGPGPSLALVGMLPNPTSSGVDVAFDLPSAMPVRVRLYDARGRLVKSLDEKTYPPGRHLVHWDGSAEDGYRPRPGVYFARLVLGTSEFTGKVVLLR